MKLIITTLATLIATTSSYARSPFPPASIICKSADQNFVLYVHENLAMIRIYDVGQKEFSFSVSDLTFKTKNNVVTARNNSDENLPKDIIFKADLNVKGINAYSIDDHAYGKTEYSCLRQ